MKDLKQQIEEMAEKAFPTNHGMLTNNGGYMQGSIDTDELAIIISNNIKKIGYAKGATEVLNAIDWDREALKKWTEEQKGNFNKASDDEVFDKVIDYLKNNIIINLK